MNYSLHYDRLIENARLRCILPGVYFEKHHIIPKCLGGTDGDDNLVDLFPEEHFVAHQLLVKIYPGNDKILSAAIVMGGRKKGREQCTNKIYGWLKERLSVLRKGKPGHPRSEETRAKMSIAKKGKSNGPRSDESIRKRTETRKLKNSASKRKPMSDETKRKISETLKLRNLTHNC